MIQFVQIRAYDNYISAHIVLARLQDAGINCHLKDEFTVTIDPLLSPALGGIKVMVAEPQVERALRILAEQNPED